MSDTSQGEGWWQASDGKWYAPELHPDYVPPGAESAAVEPESEPEPTVATPAADAEPTVVAPAADVIDSPPIEPPLEPPIVTHAAEPPPPPDDTDGRGRGRIIAAVIVIAALIAAGVAIALTRDDGKKTATTTTTSASSSSSSSSSSSESSSSGASTAELLARARRSLISGSDIGTGFERATPTSEEATFPCGGGTYDSLAKPAGSADIELDRSHDLAIIERTRVYKNETDARRAFRAARPGYDCSHGTLSTSSDSFAVTIVNRPNSFGSLDADDDVTATVEANAQSSGNGPPAHLGTTTTTTTSTSTSTDVTTTTTAQTAPLFNLDVYVARVGQTVIVLEFYALPTANVNDLDSAKAISKAAIAKFVRS